jgi:hypothetical protein
LGGRSPTAVPFPARSCAASGNASAAANAASKNPPTKGVATLIRIRFFILDYSHRREFAARGAKEAELRCTSIRMARCEVKGRRVEDASDRGLKKASRTSRTRSPST